MLVRTHTVKWLLALTMLRLMCICMYFDACMHVGKRLLACMHSVTRLLMEAYLLPIVLSAGTHVAKKLLVYMHSSFLTTCAPVSS